MLCWVLETRRPPGARPPGQATPQNNCVFVASRHCPQTYVASTVQTSPSHPLIRASAVRLITDTSSCREHLFLGTPAPLYLCAGRRDVIRTGEKRRSESVRRLYTHAFTKKKGPPALKPSRESHRVSVCLSSPHTHSSSEQIRKHNQYKTSTKRSSVFRWDKKAVGTR